jgi:tetratricopeptide (TPR) repeat protein
MKTRITLVLIIAFGLALFAPAYGQQPAKQPATVPRSSTQPATKPATIQANKPEAAAQTPTPTPVTAASLVTQGKALYRTARFKQALAKFEAALKLEPQHDEALGLAAVTAFRLDNQATAREYFLRRAELPKQKDSIKAYSFYRVALTYWRAAHDLIAKYGDIKEGRLLFALPEDKRDDARGYIRDGLKYVERALDITKNYPEAYNIRNLLQAEAALAENDEDDAEKYRERSVESLRRALALARPAPEGKAAESADFSYPTVRVAAFTLNDEDDAVLNDPMMKLIEGGRPIKRVAARFPSVRPPKSDGNTSDPSSKGVNPDGSTTSLGAGRGALTAAYAPGKVKIEMLVSTTGKVVFAHIISGRADLNGAALLAARGWTFEPATFEGRPVQLSTVVTFEMRPRR